MRDTYRLHNSHNKDRADRRDLQQVLLTDYLKGFVEGSLCLFQLIHVPLKKGIGLAVIVLTKVKKGFS